MKKSKKKRENSEFKQSAFHTFEYNKRKITIVAVLNDTNILIGHSVCSPEDKFSQEMARKISIGRALKNPLKRYYLSYNADAISLFKDYGILKAVILKESKDIEENIHKYIKGIPNETK